MIFRQILWIESDHDSPMAINGREFRISEIVFLRQDLLMDKLLRVLDMPQRLVNIICTRNYLLPHRNIVSYYII